MDRNLSHSWTNRREHFAREHTNILQVDPKRLRQKMVREQIAGRGIANPLLLQAMASVPRHLFVPEAFRAHAYDDTPLPIGQGQTISQPFMVAKMTEALNVKPGMRVLEIGIGSGYQAAILAAMGCTVLGLERIAEICAATRLRMQRLGLRSVHVHRTDGTLGFPSAAPFERILVSAGGPIVPPPLVNQLDSNNGVLIIPVGDKPQSQRLYRIRKNGFSLEKADLGPASFVNLVGNHGWNSAN